MKKVIHYCWFGGNPLPEEARACIESWKKYAPDYEIKEWNESNYDIHAIPYSSQAAKAGKWAFVSDVARMIILNKEGGLYFDTDVQLVKPIDPIAQKGPFMGIEDPIDPHNPNYLVNPGLGMAAEPGMPVLNEIIESYKSADYIDKNGNVNKKTVLNFVTDVLDRHGYKHKDELQEVGSFTIYPHDYFCPMNYSTGELKITDNTQSIHLYNMSWKSDYEIELKEIERACRQKYGANWKRPYFFKTFFKKVRHKLGLKS